MKQLKTALVAGVTGLVGNSLAELLPRSSWKVYGIAKRAKPDWFVNSPAVEYIQCDLLDKRETSRKLSALTDVTHIFWVVWVNLSDTDERGNCEANGRMLSNALDALLPYADRLEHICLQTGSKHYVGPKSMWGKVKQVDPPFMEDVPRLAVPNFYYTLEDIVYETVSRHTQLTWSIHRPSVIFGFAPRNLINLGRSLAVYGSMCKHLKLPFVFPGHLEAWEVTTDVSDAELIAEQEIWAATNVRAKNQAFNITNGDLVTWKSLWRALAEKFDVEAPEYSGNPTSVVEMMRGKEQVWKELVKMNGLHETSLGNVGRILDEAFNFPFRLLSSNQKSKEFGFAGRRNSETSLLKLIDRMRAAKIIP